VRAIQYFTNGPVWLQIGFCELWGKIGIQVSRMQKNQAEDSRINRIPG
jgi:hypothetical protein